jgi:hypothetical protein
VTQRNFPLPSRPEGQNATLSRIKRCQLAIERRNASVTSECPVELTKQSSIDEYQLQTGYIL